MPTESKVMYAFQKYLTAAVCIEQVEVGGCRSETKCRLFFTYLGFFYPH